MPATLVLVRHGRTALNADGRFRGLLDPPLDAVGLAEARAVGRALAERPVVRVVSSPLTRAVQTAGQIAVIHGIDVIMDAGLRDRDYGEWAGQFETDVVRQWGSVDAAPGVEPRAQLLARTRRTMDGQLPYLADGDVVLVSHDAVLRSLLASCDPALAASSVGQRTGCWNLVERQGESWLVRLVDQRDDGDGRDAGDGEER